MTYERRRCLIILPMDTNLILENLTEQRDRVVAAIEALTGGRTRSSPFARRRRGKMSAAARKRLSLAAKVRWAKAKKAGKNAL
jgi:hypothetical protein